MRNFTLDKNAMILVAMVAGLTALGLTILIWSMYGPLVGVIFMCFGASTIGGIAGAIVVGGLLWLEDLLRKRERRAAKKHHNKVN